MAAYRLKLAASADRTLARLPESVAAAMVEFMTGVLIESPQRVGKPLGLDLSGYHSARRGAYRIVYRIEDDHTELVVRIEHRADVYRSR